VAWCSISAVTAIAASVIAAPVAARSPAAGNAARRTVATNKIPTDAPIIATVSATTASVGAPA